MNAVVPINTQHKSLTTRFADRFGVEEGRVFGILKATAFKTKDGPPSDDQMAALMIVADQYGLNPFCKEIYAFPDKQNGIVPVVGVDGWARIINTHPSFDGMDFVQSAEKVTPPGGKDSPEWIECRIHRKDRSHPIAVREYLDEVYRPPFKGKDYTSNGPWQSHTKRMLRHKAMIQAARMAFGFVGIYDEDEAERIIEADYRIVPKLEESIDTEQVEQLNAELTDVGANIAAFCSALKVDCVESIPAKRFDEALGLVAQKRAANKRAADKAAKEQSNAAAA